jgi:uncharacterized protein (DUF2235 family)
VDKYEPGSRIWLFGLSRGAYTVRAVAGMINNCGIIKPGGGGEREAAADHIHLHCHCAKPRLHQHITTSMSVLEFRPRSLLA